MKMQKKSGSMTLYVVALFIVFMAFSAFVVDGTLTFNNRMKLQNITESSALAAAEEFNYSDNASSSEIENQVSRVARETFNILSKDGLKGCRIETKVDVDSNSSYISLKTSAIAQPFFLAFLGVEKINLNAKATAVSEKKDVSHYYNNNISWVTKKAAFKTDIISNNTDLKDTAILMPLGNFSSLNYVYSVLDYGRINGGNGKPLSLGPGGYVSIRLPVPIVDKAGNDLYINEIGAKEGYMVFVGIDKDPDNPYTKSGVESGGIYWVNISQYGTSADKIDSPTGYSSTGDKIYGSAYFDISKAGLSVVKYIRIIDDNEESAYVKDNGTYYKTRLYGESSSCTAGADIGTVTVLNHVKLATPVDF